MIQLPIKKCLTLFICLIFILTPVSATEETNNNADTQACGITASEQLLQKNGIKYDEKELEQCICEDETCNAPINQLHDCLKQNNLTTYVYHINKDKLKVNDVIHTQINGVGHFTVYNGNKADLTGFTGYILTTRQIPGQKEVPIETQEKIRGQCWPILVLLGECLANPLCNKALVMGVGSGATSMALCLLDVNKCKKNIKTAWNKVHKHKKRR